MDAPELVRRTIKVNYRGHQRNLAMPLEKNHLKEIGRYGRLPFSLWIP